VLALGIIRAIQLHGLRKDALRFSGLFLLCAFPCILLAVLKNLSIAGTALPLNTQFQPEGSLSTGSLAWSLRNLGWSYWFAFGRTYSIVLPPAAYILIVGGGVIAAGLGLWKERSTCRDLTVFAAAAIGLAVTASVCYTLSYPSGANTSWGKNLYPAILPTALCMAFGWRHASADGGRIVTAAGSTCLFAGCCWALMQLMAL
jgi:hypothetical protein